MVSSEIRADIVEEGRRVLDAAREAGLTVRLLGGVAVNVRSSGLPPELTREYKDLDFATSKKSSGDLQKLLQPRVHGGCRRRRVRSDAADAGPLRPRRRVLRLTSGRQRVVSPPAWGG